MKTVTKSHLAIFPVLALLMASICADSHAYDLDAQVRPDVQSAAEHADHDALASHYQNLAQEMHAKAEEQVELFAHKPSANKFGRNARTIRSHIEYRIHNYEQVAAEYREKAAYHQELADAQSNWKSAVKPEKGSDKESS